MSGKKAGGFALRGVLLLGMCVVSAALGSAFSRNFGVSTYTLSYADFISIMLTACSVLLALVTIFLAVLGVIGWNAISSGVRERTENFLDKGFEEGNHLYSMVEAKVTEIMFQGVKPVDDAADAEDAPDNFQGVQAVDMVVKIAPGVEGGSRG